MEQYQPEKWIWTEADFDTMGWHDSAVHGVSFLPDQFELAFDIDYIFQWVDRAADETYFNFWVAPATLVFKSVYDVRFDFELDFAEGLEISDIKRTDNRPVNSDNPLAGQDWRWNIETHQGDITLRATSYEQFIRLLPSFGRQQTVESARRGGVSFFRGRLDD